MKTIKNKSFEVEVVAPDTKEEEDEIKKIIREVKEEDKNRDPKKFIVINNRKK